MKAFIRADASVQIGTGHIMRCLTLAKDLAGRGAEAFFVCRDLPGNMGEYIQNKGFRVWMLPSLSGTGDADYFQQLRKHWEQDADETKRIILQHNTDEEIMLIVDHYSLDIKWEQSLRPFVKEILIIDDLADRPHDCDRLLDQNFYQNMNKRYLGLVPPNCQMLLGPRYALLRREFHEVKKSLRLRDGIVRRVLIFFGGSDPTHETLKALEAYKLLQRPGITADVVVGSSNPNREVIRQICVGLKNVNFYCQTDNMAELMAGADLAVGAGGTSIWERCFLGLPAIVVAVAENQVETSRDLAETGAVHYLGRFEEADPVSLYVMLKGLINNPLQLREMSKHCLDLFT